MAEIGSWNGHIFVVSPTLIRSFTGLTVTGSSETEDKTSGNQKYVAWKNGNPSEISLTVELNAFTGCDVRDEALAFVDEARSGASGYFYLGGRKLVACALLLTQASITETMIAPGGIWTSCKVQLTMKQCSKTGNAVSGAGYGSSGASAKKASVRTSSAASALRRSDGDLNEISKADAKSSSLNAAAYISAAVATSNTARMRSLTSKKPASTIKSKITSTVSASHNAFLD